jgi:hypothetical protein
LALSEIGDLIPVLLVGIGLVVAGVWVVRLGRRRGNNLWRFVGSVVVILGLVAAVPSAIILALVFIWTLP